VPACEYSSQIVGGKALKSRWIQELLGKQLFVQPAATLAIPFGTLRVLMDHHHENVAANAIVTHRLRAAELLDPLVQRLEWASELKKCRCAFPSPVIKLATRFLCATTGSSQLTT
jgi:hypothetical protein